MHGGQYLTRAILSALSIDTDHCAHTYAALYRFLLKNLLHSWDFTLCVKLYSVANIYGCNSCIGCIRIEVEIYLVYFDPFCDAKSFRFIQLEFLVENFDIYDFIENVINYNLINIFDTLKSKIITIHWLLIKKIICSVLLKILSITSLCWIFKLVQENIQIWLWMVHYVYNNLIYLNIIVLYCYITLNVINKFNCLWNKNFHCIIFRIAKILNGTFIKDTIYYWWKIIWQKCVGRM